MIPTNRDTACMVCGATITRESTGEMMQIPPIEPAYQFYHEGMQRDIVGHESIDVTILSTTFHTDPSHHVVSAER